MKKYPKTTAIKAISRKCTCASWFAAVSCRSFRNFHAPVAANRANIPKKTPVNSSHRTPDSFTNGSHTAPPKRLLPCARPSFACRTWAVVRTACSPSRAPAAATLSSVGTVVAFTLAPKGSERSLHPPPSPASWRQREPQIPAHVRTEPNPYSKCSLSAYFRETFRVEKHNGLFAASNFHRRQMRRGRRGHKDEEFYLDGRWILCSGSRIAYLVSRPDPAHTGTCSQSRSRLGRPSHQLCNEINSLIQCHCLWSRLGVFCTEHASSTRNAVPRRSRWAGNTRCAVDCTQRAARRWH